MALIGSNTNVNVTRMLGGVKGTKGIQKVAKDVAETAGAVVQDGLAPSVQKSLAKDIQKLKVQVSGVEGHSKTSTASVLMAAGAILSGPSGVVTSSLSERLSTAMSSPKTAKALAEQSVEAASSGTNMENAQMNHMGIQVTSALVKEGVKGSNVPTALFMSGAIQHHQSGRQ